MTPFGWLALAVAVLALAGPAAAPARVGALTGAGRLAPPTRPSRRVPRWRPPPRLLAGGVGCAATLGVAVAGGVALAVAVAAALGTGWLIARDLALRRLARRRSSELLGALRVAIGELEAGSRPAAALAAAAEAGPAYALVFDAAAGAAAGGSGAGAVLAAHPPTRPIGLAWQLGEELGVELAGVLSQVARDLAAGEEQRRSAEVALAGPRSSAATLTGLPLLGIALGAGMGARPWAFLFAAPAGRVVCCMGVLLDVAGVLWMRRILQRAERP